MPEKKQSHGGKRKSAGRPKGIGNRLTEDIRGLIADAVKPILQDDLVDWLKQVAPERRIELLIELMTYICPKPAPELPEQPESDDSSTNQGQDPPIAIKAIDYRTAAAPLAARPDGDNVPSSQDQGAVDGTSLG